jgi:DNA-3-methyladenine glycosylase II
MNEVAEAWRPWRGVAARLLWSYYALRRKSAASPLGDGN